MRLPPAPAHLQVLLQLEQVLVVGVARQRRLHLLQLRLVAGQLLGQVLRHLQAERRQRVRGEPGSRPRPPARQAAARGEPRPLAVRPDGAAGGGEGGGQGNGGRGRSRAQPLTSAGPLRPPATRNRDGGRGGRGRREFSRDCRAGGGWSAARDAEAAAAGHVTAAHPGTRLEEGRGRGLSETRSGLVERAGPDRTRGGASASVRR